MPSPQPSRMTFCRGSRRRRGFSLASPHQLVEIHKNGLHTVALRLLLIKATSLGRWSGGRQNSPPHGTGGYDCLPACLVLASERATSSALPSLSVRSGSPSRLTAAFHVLKRNGMLRSWFPSVNIQNSGRPIFSIHASAFSSPTTGAAGSLFFGSCVREACRRYGSVL